MGYSDDYKRGYSKGYFAGSRRAWPEFKPPNPPQEDVLALFIAAKDLADAAHDVLNVIIPDEPIFMELKNQVDSIDDAFCKISRWLKEND